jgi:hypothetical protein
MSAEERLENVERQLRRSRHQSRLLVALMLVGVSVIIGGQLLIRSVGPTIAYAQGEGSTPSALRARAFVLEDESGRVRSRLRMSEGQPDLTLYDENGKTRASVRALSRGGSIILYDENGKERIELSAASDRQVFAMSDENGKVRSVMGFNADAGAIFGMQDENGKLRAAMRADNNSQIFALSDENGRLRAAMKADNDGQGLLLVDEHGKKVWSVP